MLNYRIPSGGAEHYLYFTFERIYEDEYELFVDIMMTEDKSERKVFSISDISWEQNYYSYNKTIRITTNDFDGQIIDCGKKYRFNFYGYNMEILTDSVDGYFTRITSPHSYVPLFYSIPKVYFDQKSTIEILTEMQFI